MNSAAYTIQQQWRTHSRRSSESDGMSLSMERSRGREVAVVEFVQAERGEHVTKDFFHGLRRLCSKHGASFSVDEEQSGAWWMVVDADGRCARARAPTCTC